MASARARSQRSLNVWPGYVDALATLLLAVVFLLTVFVLAQFLLSREITGRDEVLNRLNTQIAELTELLALEKGNAQDLEDTLANLQSSLASSENERSRLQSLLDQGTGAGDAAIARIGELTQTLNEEQQVSARAMSQIELLNQQIAALRAQIAAVEQALQASEAKDQDSQAQIADLGRRLNVALAQRVQELPAVHVRQVVVQQHAVGPPRAAQRQPLRPGGGLEDLELARLAPQEAPHHRAVPRVVLHHQDRPRGQPVRRRVVAPAHALAPVLV